jgi:hypothetical protein
MRKFAVGRRHDDPRKFFDRAAISAYGPPLQLPFGGRTNDTFLAYRQDIARDSALYRLCHHSIAPGKDGAEFGAPTRGHFRFKLAKNLDGFCKVVHRRTARGAAGVFSNE